MKHGTSKSPRVSVSTTRSSSGNKKTITTKVSIEKISSTAKITVNPK